MPYQIVSSIKLWRHREEYNTRVQHTTHEQNTNKACHIQLITVDC
jgi:hypothetical protein